MEERLRQHESGVRRTVSGVTPLFLTVIFCLSFHTPRFAQADPGEPSAAGTSGWTQVIQGGLGDSQIRIINPLIEFNGSLYAGGYHEHGGCRVFRSHDGRTWETVVGTGTQTPDGFGNANNQSINAFAVLGDRLYAGTWNQVDGVEIWRTADGIAWEAVSTFRKKGERCGGVLTARRGT